MVTCFNMYIKKRKREFKYKISIIKIFKTITKIIYSNIIISNNNTIGFNEVISSKYSQKNIKI